METNITIIIGIGVFVLAIFGSAWLNLQQIKQVLEANKNELKAELSAVRAEMKALEARLSAIEQRLDRVERQLDKVFEPIPGFKKQS